jgi:capsular exopolysaccharide synthesis family protein
MDSEQSGIDLRYYLKLLTRRKWIIFAVFLTVVASTALVTWRLTPIYEAVARVEVQPASASSSDATRLLESLVDPTRGLTTQVELVQSQAALKLAAKDLGLPSPDYLREGLTVELIPDTQIVEIRVDHERPDEARDRANAIATAYITFRRERALEASLAAGKSVSRQIGDVQARIADVDVRNQQASAKQPNPVTEEFAKEQRDRVIERDRLVAQLGALESQLQILPDAEEVGRGGGTIISPAETPIVPVRPSKPRNLALAVVVGGILGVGMALLAENLDDRMKSPEEVEERVGAPVLGYIPLVKEWEEKHQSSLAAKNEAASSAAEAYRTLRTNLRFISVERPLRTILVTSATAEAGKSTCAGNLAATLAQRGYKVILVSADLRRPSVHRIFGLTNSKGLTDALDPEFPLEEVLQDPNIPNLRLLAAGGLPPNPTEILESSRFGQVLMQLSSLAEFLVIDAPPVLGLGDASALASRVDGILFLVRTAKVTKREVSHATDQLRKAGGKFIGCVLNAVEAEEGYGYYYRHYYNQYHESENGQAEKPILEKSGFRSSPDAATLGNYEGRGDA